MSDDRHPVSRRRRPPEAYTSVGEWFDDYRGSVPIQMAQALSQYMRAHDCTFAEAYAALRDRGAIIEVD